MDVTHIEDIPGLRELWASTTGVPEVCVAVLDGVVDVCHPCFRGANLQLANPLRRARLQGGAVQGHGTAIASVLFGRHESTVKGVASDCRGLIIPIYAPDGPLLRCSQADLALAIREAVRLGADVINVSGGELTPQGAPSRDLADAVQYCASKGRLLVAAAGNDGCAECLHVPGALPSVLTVGAMEQDGTPLEQSNWGKMYQAQGIVAPGRNLLVASPGDDYTLATGTSLATPLVAGVAALLASLQRKYTRRIDLALVRRLLLASAIGCKEQPTDQCERLLVGRLNVARAHSFLLRALKGLPMTATAVPVVEPASAVATSAAVPVQPVEPPTTPVRTAFVTPSVIPADCACGGNGKATQYVYVIGDKIGYDFGSRVRQLSLQGNADPNYPDPRNPSPSLANPAALLHYLLGSRKTGWPLNGNLHDSKSIYWVLYRDNCPRYVLQPHGDFSEALYKALITFLIDTTYPRQDDGSSTFDDPYLDIRYDCLREYYQCYGGAQHPLELQGGQPLTPTPLPRPQEGGGASPAEQTTSEEEPAEETKQDKSPQAPERSSPGEISTIVGEPADNRSSKVAVAGTLANKRVTLANGQQVEVIHPDLRGMSLWSSYGLFRAIGLLPPFPGIDTDALTFALRIVSRLYEISRNDGKAPQDRAGNWGATAFLHVLVGLLANASFRLLLGEDPSAQPPQNALRFTAVNDIQIRPASCQESGGEYDIEVSLFNIKNVLQGLTVVAFTVDVSDIVPVTLTTGRVYNKRS